MSGRCVMADLDRADAELDEEGKGRRPSLAEVIRSYRLLRYVKPYKKLVVVMLALIAVCAACNFGQVVVVRDLLNEGLWLPPEPMPPVSIDDVIARLPDGLQDGAKRIVGANLDKCLSEALKDQRKKVDGEELAEAEKKIREKGGSVKLASVLRPLLEPLGPKSAPGATRRVYVEMAKAIEEGLGGKLAGDDLLRFKTAADTAFAPPRESKVDMKRIRMLCGALVVMALLLGAAVYARTYVKSMIISSATRDIRNDLCGHLLTLDMGFFTNRSSGDMISRQTNDVVSGTKALLTLFDELAVEPFQAVAFAGAAVYVNWKLAAIFGVLLIILPLPMVRIARRIKRYGRQKLERIAELSTVMSEIFQGMRVTKAFNIERKKHEEFRAVNEEYVVRLFKTMKLRGLNSGLTESFMNVTMAVVMFMAAYMVTTGLFGVRLEPTDVLMFSGCMLMLYRPIKAFTKAYPDFMESVVASERVFEVFDRKPEVEDEPGAVELRPMERSIAFRNVTFAYESAEVLRDISFEVKRGEVVAVVGHSGAGKSTLLDMIPRFYDPQSGSVELDGVDIRRGTLASLRRQIAVVSQDPFLFQTTIRDNIRYGRLDATDDEVVAAAKAANIHDFIMTLPEGYGTLCGERGMKLSGGQRQRITIARAVLKDAPILILDEATSSLDTESERLVRDALGRLMERRTTFVIAHRLSTVQHADRILVLRDGRLAEAGTHAELIEAKGEYWRLYNTEFEDGE